MRYPPEHKAKTRQKILQAAGRVFRRLGYQGGGVDAVMREAGLTHGGFYSHFRNKEALFAEVVPAAMEAMPLWKSGQPSDDEAKSEAPSPAVPEDGRSWLRSVVDRYLSKPHRGATEGGCPVPTLVSEIGRSGDEPRAAFAQALGDWRDRIVPRFEHLPEDQREEAALALIIHCVGAMALARATQGDPVSEELLAAGRASLDRAYLGDPTAPPSEPPNPESS